MKSPYSNIQCPECKDLFAYQGLNDLECPNQYCKNFSEKQKQMIELKQKEENERQLKNSAVSKEEDEEKQLLLELQNLYGGYIPLNQTNSKSNDSIGTTDDSDDDGDDNPPINCGFFPP